MQLLNLAVIASSKDDGDNTLPNDREYQICSVGDDLTTKPVCACVLPNYFLYISTVVTGNKYRMCLEQ